MSSKTVLITGSNRGLGLAFAKHYTKAGWRVIGTVRNDSNTDLLKALSPFKTLTMDVTDESTVAQAAKEISGVPVDLLINNAGIFTGSEGMRSISKDSLMQEFEVHAVGPLLVTRALLPNLKLAAAQNGKKGAHVVQMSSVWGSIESGGGPYAYAASRAALHMINCRMAAEMKRDHIACIIVDPGYIPTNLPVESYEAEAEIVVASLARVIERAKMKDSGKFFHYEGHELPW